MNTGQLKFLKIVEEKQFFVPHQKVLLALSGGLDSMTLFNWLYDLREILQIEIGLAHVNHGLRKVSDNEEKELRKLAAERGVSIYVDRFTGKFTEQNARDFRYQFFANLMAENGYTVLLTGHHRGDDIETFLMREITGRPLRSLQGIAERQPFATGELIRPLLQFDKSEFDAPYFFDDVTNHGTDYFRNRVRNQLIPELTKENPQFSQAISSLSDEIRLALTVINDEIEKGNFIGEKVDLQQFQSQTFAMQHFILQAYLAQFPDLEISKAKFNELLHILNRPQQYKAPLNKKLFFIKNNQSFYLTEKLENQDLTVLSENPHDDSFMRVDLAATGDIEIRKRQPHDEILIHGHHKKLRKYFIEKHIPLEKRENFLILVDKKLYAIVDLVCSDLSIAAKNDKIKRTLWVKPVLREEK